MSGVEIAVVAGIASAAATVAEGYQAMQTGKAEQKAYNTNAEILRRNAAQKRLETSLNEDTQRKANRRQMSALRAAMAENGALESSTSVGVLGQAATDLEQDVLNMRYAGETEASNYIQQANYQDYYGKMARAQGKRAFQMSFIEGAVNGLTTYASMGGSFGGGKPALPSGGGIIAESGGVTGRGTGAYKGIISSSGGTSGRGYFKRF